jgi:hypothetical protein
VWPGRTYSAPRTLLQRVWGWGDRHRRAPALTHIVTLKASPPVLQQRLVRHLSQPQARVAQERVEEASKPAIARVVWVWIPAIGAVSEACLAVRQYRLRDVALDTRIVDRFLQSNRSPAAAPVAVDGPWPLPLGGVAAAFGTGAEPGATHDGRHFVAIHVQLFRPNPGAVGLAFPPAGGQRAEAVLPHE